MDQGPRTALSPLLTPLEQARRIAALAEEKLAESVVVLDMRPVCVYTDFFVICSGRNARQTKGIFDGVYAGMKGEQLLPRSVDGQASGNWIVVDYLDVVLHVFTPESRGFYALEDLWGDVPQIEPEQAAAS
ncbi:MAG: ribosome silencing factor [Gaiellaceae bacterium]